MDTDGHSSDSLADSLTDEAEALVEAFVHDATAATIAPASPSSSSESDSSGADGSGAESSGSESDIAELFGPGELARGCTFDEACRMLLENENAPCGEEAPHGSPCALW